MPKTVVGPNPALVWQSGAFAIGRYSASKSSPAVDMDRVFVGVDDGRLIALNRKDGSVAWEFFTRRYKVEMLTNNEIHYGIHGSPAFDEHLVYIGDYLGFLYAVDKTSGNLVWEKKLGGSIGASPVLLGDTIFIAVEYPDPDGRVFLIRAENGETIWTTPHLRAHPHASVTVDASRGLFFVGANNGRLFCFDYIARRQQWVFQTEGAIKSTAALDNGAVYFTSWDGNLYAVDAVLGTLRFRFSGRGISMSSPSVYNGLVYFGSHDSFLYAVDARSGILVRSFQTGGQVLSSPTVIPGSGLVSVGSRDNRIYLVALQTLEPKWSYLLNSGMSSVPSAVDDELFVNDDSGTVYCFRNPASAI